jgi:hypothetical protein
VPASWTTRTLRCSTGGSTISSFSAIARSNVRALLIGRRALVALGIPVLTAIAMLEKLKQGEGTTS